jgi:Spy/CpxP family protein refolding chaperone
MKQHNWPRILLMLALIATVSIVSCLIVCYLTRRSSPSSSLKYSDHWLHEQLSLTADQDKALEGIEKSFSDQRQLHLTELNAWNIELSRLIMVEDHFSPQIHTVIERIHQHQKALQQLVISHLFEMQTLLTPEQRQQLRKLTAKALAEPWDQ